MDFDPLVRGTNPVIRIRTKMARIPNIEKYTGTVPNPLIS
jgi:hypothetical protein